jgi:hypothetical protein
MQTNQLLHAASPIIADTSILIRVALVLSGGAFPLVNQPTTAIARLLKNHPAMRDVINLSTLQWERAGVRENAPKHTLLRGPS